MKILITGAAGFIGSNFVRYIEKTHPDWELRVYDKITYAGNMQNFKDKDGSDHSPHLYQKDICNYNDFIAALIEFRPDNVIHFAAESHVDNSLLDPQIFLRTNILGTENILRAVNEYNKTTTSKIQKIVHISTDEVYGTIEKGETAETHAFEPRSPYSVSKAAADMLCHAYYVSFGTPVSIIRGSNCYGPRQFPEKLIPLSLIKVFRGQKISIYGQGTNMREWIFAEDFARGVEAVLLKGKLGQAYNLGGGKPNRVMNIEIATQLLDLCKKLPAENIEFVKDRLGHDHRYALDTTKIKNELGWSPQFDLQTGLAETVKWYRENEWWWQPLL